MQVSQRSRRTAPRLATLLAAAVLAATLGLVQAPAASAGGHGYGERWYLAMGDSLAAGYQPDRGDQKYAGYVKHVLGALRADAPGTRLRNLACSGETSVTLVEGGRCSYYKGTQLATAERFLSDHKVTTITLDIGANDVVKCAASGVIDPACIATGLGQVATYLPTALTRLRAAAPRAQIIVLNYYDPILAAWLTGPAGEQVARDSVVAMNALNGIIAGSAATVGADVADVSAAFSSSDFDTLVPFPGVPAGVVPLNVARICQWTWMCVRSDIHANNAGYRVMGRTVVAVLDDRCHRAAAA